MYSLELSLRYSPFPIAIQKKEYADVKRIYVYEKSSVAGGAKRPGFSLDI